ncbi:MAG TPA: hypothetical protein VJ890_13920 [Vineibacter sp.]|nr:hypothetical protein [Vineibacter sp.]
MADAKFFKQMPVDWDLRQDGADFSGVAGMRYPFQMVPAGGTRSCQISVSGGMARVRVGNPQIARIASDPGRPPVDALTFNTSGSFSIIGGRAGTTYVIAEEPGGIMPARLHLLNVYVKDEVKVRYNLARLSDPVNTTTSMSLAEAEKILTNVEALYLSQTNVRLIKQQMKELHVGRILSDNNNVIQLDVMSNNMEDVIFAEIRSQGLSNADVVFVFTWNIEGSRDLVQTTGRPLDGRTETPERFARYRNSSRSGPTVIYINSFGSAGFHHTLTTAHELGHHFGLSHFAPRPSNYLMEAGGNRGFKMSWGDINGVNRTGI